MDNEKSFKVRENCYFKTLEMANIVFQYLITIVPRYIVNELEKIQEVFCWKNSTLGIKYETLCNGYKGRNSKTVTFHAPGLENFTTFSFMNVSCSCFT